VHLDIRGQNIPLTPSLLEHVERRLQFALARFDGRVTRVTVRVADLNGPRGGVDKRCRIAVRVRPAGEIAVEDTCPDLYAAIDVAADRIGRSVQRKVERLRDGVPMPPRAPRTTRRAARDRLGWSIARRRS